MVSRRMKKVTGVFLAICTAFCMSACGSERNNNVSLEPVKPIDIDEKYVMSSTDFAINLFKENALSDAGNGKNMIISPESIQLALSMTANGAKGDTLTQMEDVLCRGLTIDEQNEYNYSVMNKQMNDEGVELSIANSLWIKDDHNVKVRDLFLETVKTYYNADAFLKPFNTYTTDEINTWVSDNTNGMVKDILDRIDEAAILYLINAVAFEGEWEEKYEDNQVKENTDFYNVGGSVSKVSMLKSNESYYMHDEKSKAFIKPYKGGNYGFMAILPNEEVSVEEYIASMTGDGYRSLFNSRDSGMIVYAGIPEFGYDYSCLLNDNLISIGMTEAFDDANADFSNMADSRDNIYINRVLHKTHIEVDRNGTKAAAATVVEMEKVTCEGPTESVEIILDRPFIYAIVDMKTGLPIFIGTVAHF